MAWNGKFATIVFTEFQYQLVNKILIAYLVARPAFKYHAIIEINMQPSLICICNGGEVNESLTTDSPATILLRYSNSCPHFLHAQIAVAFELAAVWPLPSQPAVECARDKNELDRKMSPAWMCLELSFS